MSEPKDLIEVCRNVLGIDNSVDLIPVAQLPTVTIQRDTLEALLFAIKEHVAGLNDLIDGDGPLDSQLSEAATSASEIEASFSQLLVTKP